MSDLLPLIEELSPTLTSEAAFTALAQRPGCLFLDSALRHVELGRYSFLMCDPIETLKVTPAANIAEPFATLRSWQQRFAFETVSGLPPFQGGAAGVFSYDLNRSLERIARPRYDEFDVSASHFGLYDVVIAWDHVEHRAWIVSHGWPESDSQRRSERAAMRTQQIRKWLREPFARNPSPQRKIETADLAPQFAVAGREGLTSTFSVDSYLAAVQRGIDYIYAGDIFQVNLAQRLLTPASGDSVNLYLRLRERNPATFAAYYNTGDTQIISASPERFLSVRDHRIETRPIKGTRRRSHLPEADLYAGDELQESEKDRAENVMIVDLLRNDLSRVCRPESVKVTQLCGLETYQFVQHLVSVVAGQLQPGQTAIDAIHAAFPGGSITGAPKVRAMQIIAEIEPTARGPYCGSLGYLGFDGACDMNILIRTITAAGGYWQFPVGGGIVAQSHPRREYEETWHKAEGLLRAIEQ